MSSHNHWAAQAAAMVSFKPPQLGPEVKIKAKKSGVRAMLLNRSQRQTQDEDTEMLDADSVEPREAPSSNCESVVIPGPFSSSSGQQTQEGATNTEIPRPGQQHVVEVDPHTTSIKLRTVRELEKDVVELQKSHWSVCLERDKLKKHEIPTYQEIIARLKSDLAKSDPERLKHLEWQVDEWRSHAESSDEKTSILERQLNDVEKDRKKLHDGLHCKREKRIHSPKSCVDGDQDSSERLEASFVLSHENDDLVQQKENLMKECYEWRQDFELVSQRSQNLEEENQMLQKKFDDQKVFSERAILENKALKERIDHQELRLTKAQNAAMSVLSHSLSAVLPDDRIRTRFDQLFERIAEWARENAATPDQAILAHPENVLKWRTEDCLLRHIGEVNSTPNLNFDLQDDTAVDTLLNAALARRFCKDFLKNPFWFAETSSPISYSSLPQGERLGTDVALMRSLNKMMEYHKDHEAKVHAWRASTVQTLIDSDQVREIVSTSHRHYLEDEILTRYGELIRTPLPPSDRDELMAIIESFANFAVELWSQKTVVECFHLDTFASRVYRQGNKYMEIARAVGIEDGDKRLDGSPIPVVVQPLILGFGTHDGKDYEKHKVWSKAVVWVRKD